VELGDREMDDFQKLTAEKEQLKNKITDYILTWQERMFLYKEVQQINEHINKKESRNGLGKEEN
jgi:hypothetical protein